MKAELVKRQDRWDLYGEDGSKIASSAPNPIGKLSIKNCEAIDNGYDLDELAEEYATGKSSSDVFKNAHQRDFTKGFQKALELLGDKKFSINDMEKLMFATLEFTDTQEEGETYPFFKSFIQSLQQTEWDVEILMGTNYRHIDCVDMGDLVASKIVKDNEAPMLDKDGCLILKGI